MREVVLDTETTGLNVHNGHKIIEIGALEIINLVPSGRTLHLYINPERDIDEEAIKIHTALHKSLYQINYFQTNSTRVSRFY